MKNINKAVKSLSSSMNERDQRAPIPFEEFLNFVIEKPTIAIRNIFQVFYDMVKTYVKEEEDEYVGDSESIHYVNYDCDKLFVIDADHPFFADRLFSNRLLSLVEALKRGAQQNKIYIFEGPPGCGKSTFLNNLLKKFEEYSHTEQGLRFETVWKLDKELLGDLVESDLGTSNEKLVQLLLNAVSNDPKNEFHNHLTFPANGDCLEIPCPSHDNPILMIPKHFRRAFFDDLFRNDEFKYVLSTEKDFGWVFRDPPCTICSSLYSVLLEKLKDPMKVFEMLYAQPYQFNRRLGKGISVFNPGDRPMQQIVMTNEILQQRINRMMKDSNQVQYLYSRFAKTNNGIYALMDIKSHNTERLIELHNIISEGVHKVEDVEENVSSLFLAVMNPEDKPNLQGSRSFLDRIEYINIPYVMDLTTEVQIYRNTFGSHIDGSFLPRVIQNFARVIISSRLNRRSDALLEWIERPEKYRIYCDENLQLIKMEIYRGHIPVWLSEEDRKRFTAKRRRNIIAESEKEGEKGISGRDSIKIFNEFFSTYAKEDKLINMSMLRQFFAGFQKKHGRLIPDGFLDSLLRMYDYTILQEVKESLYFYNEEKISKDIQNYMFAINFEPGAVGVCNYTGEKLEITDEYLDGIEKNLLGKTVEKSKQLAFRRDTQKEYTSKTLTQEIMNEEKDITDTHLYQDMHDRYVHNLKEKVLDPFLENENFRRAIKDFDKESFKSYDQKIQDDVTFLVNNLYDKYNYSKQGAKEICIYVIDNDIAKNFAGP